ncbi:hypothetical protein D3C78_1805560 [compost metagenome]
MLGSGIGHRTGTVILFTLQAHDITGHGQYVVGAGPVGIPAAHGLIMTLVFIKVPHDHAGRGIFGGAAGDIIEKLLAQQ